MRTANINSVRCIGIKVASALLGLGLLIGPGGALRAAEPQVPAPRINADPAFPFSREIEAFAKANEAGPAVADATLFLGSSSIRLWDIGGSFPDTGKIGRASCTERVCQYG